MKPIRTLPSILVLILMAAVSGTCCTESGHSDKECEPLLRFTGRIYPDRFLSVTGESFGHHAVTWKEGRAAPLALIQADIPDVNVSIQLEKKGLRGGNNLERSAWDARTDPNNPEPDKRVEGDPVEVFVSWKGLSNPVTLQDILGLPDADYRFGDHRKWIPYWKSGCIVCNVSCPGARISNRSLTIRDQVRHRLKPLLNRDELPPDGTPVVISIYQGETGCNEK